nr:hypothetical protein [Tanacetum cinerariifolium]
MSVVKTNQSQRPRYQYFVKEYQVKDQDPRSQDPLHTSKIIPKNTRLQDSRRHKKDPQLNDHPLGGDFLGGIAASTPPLTDEITAGTVAINNTSTTLHRRLISHPYKDRPSMERLFDDVVLRTFYWIRYRCKDRPSMERLFDDVVLRTFYWIRYRSDGGAYILWRWTHMKDGFCGSTVFTFLSKTSRCLREFSKLCGGYYGISVIKLFLKQSKWNGDVVIMGDFNEVRFKSDRFGSTFNDRGAALFNTFISSSGLMEVNLGGSAFTRCHKSTSKMNICNAALNDVDSRIDNGHATEEDVKKRAELISRMCDIDKLKSMKMAQKIKVKWAMDSDENSSFFHGILNTKRNIQNIHGIMVNGNWEQKPDRLKSEFGDVSNAEIKNAVWDCGTDKASGPDGFSFGFYRRDVQSAFIVDRHILDGPFILNEVLQWCKVKKKQALVFKVDFEKAYDSVRWDFLDEEFQFGKGLKQGDPLAPFLFILIMESLHLSFQRVVDAGLKINMRKSRIIGVHANSNKVNMVAQQLGCLVLKAPFIYLGSMVGEIMSKTNAWNDVVDKIRCQFFNGHEYNSRKASWIKWKMALTSKERGGLGVSSLCALNRGLLIKWLWRFYSNDSSLWTRVIKAIHGVDSKVNSVIKAGNRSCWLNIVLEVDVLKNRGINIKSLIHIKIGDAEKYGFEFSNETAEMLHQAQIKTHKNLVPAAGDPACSIVSTGSVPASSVPAGSVPAGSVPAGGVLAGSVNSAGFGDPATSESVPAVFNPNHADNSTLPLGHSLGSSEHTTSFPSLSDLGNHQPKAGIFSSSSYDDDFCVDVTNLASCVVVDFVATKRANTIHTQS